MGINGVGGVPSYMGMQSTQGVQSAQRAQTPMAAGGVNAREIADNEMARRSLPMDTSATAARAATEAKGLFVDTYA